MSLLATHALLGNRQDWPTPQAFRRASAALQVVAAALGVSAARSLGRGLTASPLPRERAVLRDSGPYALVRHPIYTALLLGVGARTAASGDRRQVAVFGMLFVLLRYKSGFEEQALASLFAEYAAYAARTPRLVPRPRRDRRR